MKKIVPTFKKQHFTRKDNEKLKQAKNLQAHNGKK